MAGSLDQPVHIAHAGDGSGRLFIVEQPGRIRVLKDGALLETPFLDIIDRVSCCVERGLLGVAFPPGYAEKGYFYVNYTNSDGNTRVSRFRVTENLNIADPVSEEILPEVDQPRTNHNGGQIAFGPMDGYLYIGLGDGGGGGDPYRNGQNPESLLGKLLRIDVEAGISPYALPASNPYTQTAGYRGEIWALGLRNPWRFSFDRQTGDLYIADVGQATWEEINFQPAESAGGENYGWNINIMEGRHCFNAESCDTDGLTLPVVEYPHGIGDCSVTSGFVYRGDGHPRMAGIYFYDDYCSGKVWGMRQVDGKWQSVLLVDTEFDGGITSFGEEEAGNLYVTNFDRNESTSEIYLIAGSVEATPTSTSSPLPAVTRSFTVTGTPTIIPTTSATPAATATVTASPTATSPVLPTDTTIPTRERIRLPLILK